MQNNDYNPNTNTFNTRREETPSTGFYCSDCEETLISKNSNYQRHFSTQKHRSNVLLRSQQQRDHQQQGSSSAPVDLNIGLEEGAVEDDSDDDDDFYHDHVEVPHEEEEDDEEGNLDTIMGEASEPVPPPVSSSYPFRDELSMYAILYLRSTGSAYSELEVQRLLRFAEKMSEVAVKLRDEEYEAESAKLPIGHRTPQGLVQRMKSKKLIKSFPKANGIIHYLDKHKDVPSFESEEHSIAISRGGRGDVKKLFINKPSEILKVCLGQPEMSPEMSRLPDRTPGQCVDMAQGEKWKTHPDFQWPMISFEVGSNGDQRKEQLWIGDTIQFNNDLQQPHMCVVSGFYTLNRSDVFVECFPVLSMFNQPGLFLDTKKVSYSLDDLCAWQYCNYRFISDYYVLYKGCFLDSLGRYNLMGELDQVHIDVFTRGQRFKQHVEGSTLPLDVKVVPITLFSDDTSGNRSKKWNCFDSWSMTPAALPLSMRNQKISQHFICASNELKAPEMLPPIVDDLVQLEKGIRMYDAKKKEVVVVVSPILFINADNPRHADVSCTMNSAAGRPCRFCYWSADERRFAKSARTTFRDYVATHREPDHLKAFLNGSTPLGFPLELKDKFRAPVVHDDCANLNYKKTGGEELLRLSSWDPSKDCPVEILHTLLLGIVKYTWTLVADKLFNVSQLKVIQDNLRRYHTKAFPTLNSSISHYKSFLGRDYKIMVQTMPTILKTSFKDDSFGSCSDSVKAGIFNCFDSISCLTSLLYMGEIRYNLEDYLKELECTVHALITAMDELDHLQDMPVTRGRPTAMDSSTTSKTGPICNRLKTHLLVHVVECVQRFGSLLWCETEKNEQFNASIRGALIKSNRKESSKHLCKFFGRIEHLQLIAMGGSWDYGTKTGGSSIKAFFNSEDAKGLYLSADRLFKENNHADVQKIVVGVSAIFKVDVDGQSNQLVLGKVVEKKKDVVMIEEYKFALVNESAQVAGASTVFLACRKDDAGNFLTRSTNRVIMGRAHHQIRIDEVLDMSQVTEIDGQDFSTVNKSKNGTMWWSKCVCPLTFRPIINEIRHS